MDRQINKFQVFGEGNQNDYEFEGSQNEGLDGSDEILKWDNSQKMLEEFEEEESAVKSCYDLKARSSVVGGWQYSRNSRKIQTWRIESYKNNMQYL